MEHNSSYNDDLKELSKRKIEEYAGTIAFTLVVIVFGLLGNIMSVIFYGFKVQRTTTHVIITGLAIVDLIACVLFSDLIVEICFTVTFKNKPGCKVMNFLNYWLETTSGFMLLFVAFDRYRKICRPFAWQLSIKTVHISFLIIIIAGMVYSVRHLLIFDVVHVNVTDAEGGKTIEVFYCTHSKDPGLKTVITLFHVLDLLTFIAVICGCISLYSLISRALWVSSKNTKHINKGEWCSKDGNQERASTNSSYTGVRNTGEKSSNDTQSDNIKNDAVKHTKHPSCVPPNPDEISQEKLDSNADPFANLSGDIAVVKDEDKSLKINSQGEVKLRDANVMLMNVTCKSDTDPKHNRDKILYSNKSKQYQIERKVTLIMIFISISTLISFVPYFIIDVTLRQKEDLSEQDFSVGIQIALRSFILNNAINPYIIGLFNSKFRQFVKDTFCKCIGRN